MPTTTISVATAEQQLATATDKLDKLKAKILDKGPGAVTAQELADAADAVEHAKLTIEHAIKTAEDNATAERLDHLQLLKQQILAGAGDTDTALDAMRQLEDAAALLITTCAGRQTGINKWTAALRAAGVPQYEPQGKSRTTADGRTNTPYTQLTDEHAGMGWTEASMGRGDAVYVDDRRIAHISPGVIIAAALERAARQAGYGIRHLQPVLDVNGVDQAATADPEAWLRARY
ncbi:hypothetical protein R6V09_12415 [Streptomyces sp. W16]|uniref:hypothetical protein n=1 Tax=Streptomyces sp. W16 TaxID=3076631 RepID=UPI00295AF32B|nr:hypothetical protein [Streptomyces sp. W16]MDV9170935.1 hypothetical protein [Streptomyces sp. W16]